MRDYEIIGYIQNGLLGNTRDFCLFDPEEEIFELIETDQEDAEIFGYALMNSSGRITGVLFYDEDEANRASDEEFKVIKLGTPYNEE